MSAILNPYLNFRTETRDAMTFYQSVFGGDLNLSTFAEFGMTEGIEEHERDLVMHSQLETPAGFTLMAADVPTHMDYATGTNQFSVSLSGDDEAQLRGYWDKLSDGATVLQPLQQAPWGDSFGMLVDRFGVTWLVNIAGSGPAEG
jgi:PhnB protein